MYQQRKERLYLPTKLTDIEWLEWPGGSGDGGVD